KVEVLPGLFALVGGRRRPGRGRVAGEGRGRGRPYGRGGGALDRQVVEDVGRILGQIEGLEGRRIEIGGGRRGALAWGRRDGGVRGPRWREGERPAAPREQRAPPPTGADGRGHPGGDVGRPGLRHVRPLPRGRRAGLLEHGAVLEA